MSPVLLKIRSRLSSYLRETWDASATAGFCCTTRGVTLVKRFTDPSSSAGNPGQPQPAPGEAESAAVVVPQEKAGATLVRLKF